MKYFFSTILLLTFWAGFSQTSGTITIEKKDTLIHPVVRFMGLENGPVQLKSYFTDRCLDANVGVIESFEVVIADEKGNWDWLKNDSACFSGENYEKLKELGNGANVEFMNILGMNDQGVKIIFPGMKFVIRKTN